MRSYKRLHVLVADKFKERGYRNITVRTELLLLRNSAMESRVQRKRARIWLLSAMCVLVFVSKTTTRSHRRQNIVFGINTIESNRALLNAALHSWAKDVTTVITDCKQSTPHVQVTRTTDVCSEYPPIQSWISTLVEMRKVNADWYFKADDDTYVNVPKLNEMIVELQDSGYGPDKFIYLGSFAPGREYERELLGLHGKPFVQGGPGILMSRRAMDAILPLLHECMHMIAESMHSDTQLARCVYAILPDYAKQNAHIIKRFSTRFKAYYPHQEIKQIRPMHGSTVPVQLSEKDSTYVSLHCVKTPEHMLSVHSQLQP